MVMIVILTSVVVMVMAMVDVLAMMARMQPTFVAMIVATPRNLTAHRDHGARGNGRIDANRNDCRHVVCLRR